MTVGLVLVTYNAEAFIRRTLDAVAAQTRPPDEVVILDNHSTDATWRALEESTRDWSIPVRLIQAGANLGFAAGNNRAVAALGGAHELIALLNPDAFPDPHWLATLLDAAARHPEAGSFASRLMMATQPGMLDGAGDVCHVSGIVWRHGHGRPLREVPEASSSRPVFSACAAAALYRRADWELVGGLDERFFCYAEDVDLGFRLQLADRGCWYVADAVAHHLGSASTGVDSPFAVYHGHRNLAWMFVKNMPASLLLRYLPLHLATTMVGLLVFTRRGRGGPYLKAKWDALTGLAATWRARQQVQGTRRVAVAALRARLDGSGLWRRLGA